MTSQNHPADGVANTAIQSRKRTKRERNQQVHHVFVWSMVFWVSVVMAMMMILMPFQCANNNIQQAMPWFALGFVSPAATTTTRKLRRSDSRSPAYPHSTRNRLSLRYESKLCLFERRSSSVSETDENLPPVVLLKASARNETETTTSKYATPVTTKSNIAPEFMTPLSSSKLSKLSSFRQWVRDSIFLGIDPSPDIVAIATIYFVEGALGLARLAQTYLLKDELHLGPAGLSALTGIFTLPWTIKPLYGFLSDGFPLWGYRRRSYLILAGLTGCLSYSLVGHKFWGLLDPQPDIIIPATVAALVVSSACIAFSDVVADGIVVQKTRDSNDPKIAGGLQSLCWGSAAVGGLLSAYFSGSLLEMMTPQDVFIITAILPFLVASIAFLINEKPQPRKTRTPQVDYDNSPAHDTEESNEVRAQIDALWAAIKQPSVYKPALFLFLWQSTPTSDGAMFFFMTEDLKFGPEFLGRVRVVTAVASLFGIWLYNQFLKTKRIKDILFWSTIISTPLGLLNLLLITHVNRDLGIPDTWFVFGDDVVLSVLGEIAFLPTLVLAARLCPPGVEAVLFATLMSINNGAGTLGTEIGAWLTKLMGVTESNFDNLALLSIMCNLSSVYPLLFIGWLDEVGSVSEQEMEDEESVLDTTAT
jgi:folate/biopterin transporter